MRHENGVDYCPRCEQKLKEANSAMVSFFYWVKSNHPSVHISWSFRDQANQDQCFMNGSSRLKWPNSPHNALNLLDDPDAHAIDLFLLDDDGKAQWPKALFLTISNEVKFAGLPLKWGGDFTHLGDFDHFQMA